MAVFGTIGIFRKYTPIPSSALAMLRALIGVVFLCIYCKTTGHKFDFKAAKQNAMYLIPSGIMMGFNWILLFEAYNYTSVAVATLCYYMAPVIVILLSPLLFREKLTTKGMAKAGIAIVGIAMVSGVIPSFEVSGPRGIELGLGAAMLYAGVVCINKRATDIDGYTKTIVQLLTAFVVILPYVLLTEDISALEFSPVCITMVAILGIVHTGIAYALYFGSVSDIPAQKVALLSYIDPVVAVLLSALFLQEPMSIWGWIGAVMVFLGML